MVTDDQDVRILRGDLHEFLHDDPDVLPEFRHFFREHLQEVVDDNGVVLKVAAGERQVVQDVLEAVPRLEFVAVDDAGRVCRVDETCRDVIEAALERDEVGVRQPLYDLRAHRTEPGGPLGFSHAVPVVGAVIGVFISESPFKEDPVVADPAAGTGRGLDDGLFVVFLYFISLISSHITQTSILHL